MNVCVIGGGGREHAIVQGLAKSSSLKRLVVVPGNGGIGEHAEVVAVSTRYPYRELIEFLQREAMDLVVVGPEQPMVEGLVDVLQEKNIMVFGCPKYSALLEGSKHYAKQFMASAGIPTASYKLARSKEQAWGCLQEMKPPYVLKADGLCSGKGVVVAQTMEQAEEALVRYYDEGVFGVAASTVLVEQYLPGEEVSVLAFFDGETVHLMPPCQDYKRLHSGEGAPNTGGMGAITPVPHFTDRHKSQCMEQVFEPFVRAIRERQMAYHGVIYAGLKVSGDQLNVLEFNVRFGDPEAQCLLPLLRTDLLDIMLSTCTGDLGLMDVKWRKKASVNVVLAAKDYPGKPQTGKLIEGLDSFDPGRGDVYCFHSGTIQLDSRTFVNSGGRILSMTALGGSLEEARRRAYQSLKELRVDGAFFREDIGLGVLKPVY